MKNGKIYRAEEKGMEYVLSLSYGKDSLACLGAIEELGWPLDRIVHAEVWATDTIPADLPPMVEFKAKADAIIKERWGLDVEHVSSGVTFENGFCFKRGRTGRRTKFDGKMYGWPMAKGQWCLQQLKLPALSKIQVKGQAIQYIGIAADEPSRFHNLADTKKSPLVEVCWTEAMCRDWCEKNDLLSPIYTTATRGVLVLPQSERQSAPAIAQKLPGILGTHAQVGQRQPGYISCGWTHRPRL